MLLFSFQIGEPSQIVRNNVMIFAFGTLDNDDAFFVRLLVERFGYSIIANLASERDG